MHKTFHRIIQNSRVKMVYTGSKTQIIIVVRKVVHS